MMAQYIRTHNNYQIHDAKISEPYERYGGLLRGGTFPTVCVVIVRDSFLGFATRDVWVLTIENGQVHEIEKAFDSCSELSPFTELIP